MLAHCAANTAASCLARDPRASGGAQRATPSGVGCQRGLSQRRQASAMASKSDRQSLPQGKYLYPGQWRQQRLAPQPARDLEVIGNWRHPTPQPDKARALVPGRFARLRRPAKNSSFGVECWRIWPLLSARVPGAVR